MRINKIGTAMFAYGVTRVADNPRAVRVLLRHEPTDDDLRALHEALRPIDAGNIVRANAHTLNNRREQVSKYYKRSAVIEAINFDDLVQHGIDSGGNIVNSMPWSFTYHGHRITHENDDCYLIASPNGGSLPFRRGDMLTFCGDSSLFPMELAYFCMTYAELPETPSAPPPEQEGMTIKGDGASELGKLMREQRQGGPVPHA
jgi:hypothetical protein